MNEANDNDLGWRLLFKDHGVWLYWRDGEQAFNLGPERPVMAHLADQLGPGICHAP